MAPPDERPAPAPRSCRLTSASFGALITSLTMTPLDVIRVRMQSTSAQATGQYMLRPLCPEAGSIVAPCRTGPFTYRVWTGSPSTDLWSMPWCSRCHQPSYTRISDQNTFRSMFRLIRREGIPSLWRGLTPTLAQSIPSTVLYFNAYEELRQVALAPALAGAVARIGAATLVSPIELVRTRIMAHSGRPESAWAQLENVSKEVAGECRAGGVRVLFRGLGPTLFRDVPFSALYWTGFESIRTRVQRSINDTTPGAAISAFVAGTISGAVAAICTQPFDVVKTRQQIEQFNGGRSTRHVLDEILQNGGWRGLFTGLTPRVAKIAPACAIMISSYELGKVLLDRSRTTPPS